MIGEEVHGGYLSASLRQSSRPHASPAPGVENAATGDGLQPREQPTIGIATTQDGVLLPVRRGGLALDAGPGLADAPGIEHAQSRSEVLAHDLSLSERACGMRRSDRPRSRRLGLAIAVLGVLVAGCSNEPPPPPPQPIAFNHKVHIDNKIECTRCHRGAETQAEAGLPPMATCAGCHRRQATDNPEVQKFMKQYDNGRGEPLVWRRVYTLPAEAMVHFKHKPHIRAGVECATCHGDLSQMTVAQEVVNVANMGWCLDCHRERGAPTDCLTCHH
jgi:Cytochrome c7 and related cytochrome c/Class III cytochrome C family